MWTVFIQVWQCQYDPVMHSPRYPLSPYTIIRHSLLPLALKYFHPVPLCLLSLPRILTNHLSGRCTWVYRVMGLKGLWVGSRQNCLLQHLAQALDRVRTFLAYVRYVPKSAVMFPSIFFFFWLFSIWLNCPVRALKRCYVSKYFLHFLGVFFWSIWLNCPMCT